MQNNNSGDSSQHKLVTEQLRQWINTMPVLNVLEPLFAALLLWLYWDLRPPGEVVGWFAVVLFVVLIRSAAAQFYHQLDTSDSRTKTWRALFLFLSAASGALFSFAVIRFNPPELLFASELLTVQLFMVASVVGLMIVTLVCNSVYLPAMLLGVAAIAIPGTWHIGQSNLEGAGWIVMILSVLNGCLLLAGWEINRRTLKNIALQQKNLGLIEYLEKDRVDAEALNEKLSREIYDRKLARQHLV